MRRRPGENRERLQEAGLIEFGLFGFHGTSTGRIAARASVPQPHVYTNFRTKQELFLACVARAVDDIVSSGYGDAELATLPLEAACVVYQAYGAAQDSSLSADLSPLLSELEAHVDDEVRAGLFVHAASALRKTSGAAPTARSRTQLNQ